MSLQNEETLSPDAAALADHLLPSSLVSSVLVRDPEPICRLGADDVHCENVSNGRRLIRIAVSTLDQYSSSYEETDPTLR